MWNKVLILVFMSVSLSIHAQKGEKPVEYKSKDVMKEINLQMKNSQFAQAEKSFQSAVTKYKEAGSDEKLYNTAIEIQRQLVLEQNKNMYLKNNRADTAKFFQHIYNIYDYAIHLDSLESQPDEKGRVKYKYRAHNARTMQSYRNNLRAAGNFFYLKRKYSDAYKHISMLLESHHADIIKSLGDTTVEKEDLVKPATIAVLSAYAAKSYKDAVKYIGIALEDTATNKYLLEVGAKSFAQIGDTINGVKMLYSGVRNHSDYDYFFLTLVKYHNEHNQYDRSLKLARYITSKYPKNRDYWYIRGKEEIYMNLGDSALLSFSQAVVNKADDAESYSEMGKIYLGRAQEYYKSLSAAQLNAESRRKLKDMYSDACRNFEAARKYKEDDRSLWLSGLKECYFKLNRGKELRALERLK